MGSGGAGAPPQGAGAELLPRSVCTGWNGKTTTVSLQPLAIDDAATVWVCKWGADWVCDYGSNRNSWCQGRQLLPVTGCDLPAVRGQMTCWESGATLSKPTGRRSERTAVGPTVPGPLAAKTEQGTRWMTET